MSKDYYKIIGVEKGASQEEIKRSFRKLAHEHHPDKKTGSEEKFKELNEAYQVLSNPEKRKQYDQFGSTFDQAGGPGAGFSGFGGQGGGVNFDYEDLGDIVGNIFGFGGGRQGRSRRQTRGRDLEIEMAIDFKEAVFGTEKELELEKNIVCPKCTGNGAEPGTKIEECKNCQGTGQVAQSQRTILGNIQMQAPCPECSGQGKVASEKCKHCTGNGRVRDRVNIKFKVPAGIDDSQSIRLQGKGEAGQSGVPAGDLYIHFRVRPDKDFTREGSNILTEQGISFSQAALGDKIEVKTIDGPVKLKIPAGTESGKVFKLTNRGVPIPGSSDRGAHLVKINIVTPKKLTKKQRELFEKIRDEEKGKGWGFF